MKRLMRATIACALVCLFVSACGSGSGQMADSSVAQNTENSESPGQSSAVPIPAGQIEQAIGRIDGLANDLMVRTGIPGMSIAVVHGGKTVYAKGFGVRAVDDHALVDANTVFQIASLSKPVGATVVAHQVGVGSINWDTPVRNSLPWFSLNDLYVSEQLTIADLYSHRSGLPDHAGDKLEDLGYDRTQVLERIRLVPLASFRSTYAYTNFGVTAAAEAVAAASGLDWDSLSEQAIYKPLGMNSTSSRFADYKERPNRAKGHVQSNGAYILGQERNPDAQSPAGGVSSSANDMAMWLAFLLANGSAGGREIVDPAALLPAITPQIISSPPETADARAGFYGYGFNVGISAAGRTTISHSGAFLLGAATNFVAIPSADVAIVVLTNGTPIGVPETLTAQFSDLVQFGSIQRDWFALYKKAFASLHVPEGSLVGKTKPANPAPAQALTAYTGIYSNDYYGPLTVTENQGVLELRLGPTPTVFRLDHWDGDVFTFTLDNENAPPGTISKASFSPEKVILEYYDDWRLGTFTRG